MNGISEVLEKIVKAFASICGIFVGIVQGFIKSSYSYFKGMKYIANNNYSVRAKEMFDEPAEEKYFFYEQYEDLKNSYYSAAAVNKGNILLYKKAEQENHCSLGRAKGALVSIYVFGNIFNIIYFFIHFIIITIISIPIYAFYFIIKTIESIKLKKKSLGTICTYCYSKFDIPYYLCPNCGRIHKNLVSGPYGILKRKCSCGEIIASANISGRHRLSAVCPVCLKKSEVKEIPSACIAFIGEEASGKTTFIYSIIHYLLNSKKWNVEFLDSMKKEGFNNVNEWSCNLENLKEHRILYNIFISSKENFIKKLLYIYDTKGENFNSISRIITQKYYKYVNALVFIVDPLCIDEVIEGEFVKNEFKELSSKNINDLLDRFIISMKKLCEIEADEKINVPIAVVINKMDLMDYNGTPIDFLKLVREEKFIRKVQYNFSNSEFFFTENLNSISNDIKVAEPVEWILNKV
ncbi:TRAFAC clade GTPase domain-containing protein [Clostridium scatologenes]|uniref:Double-GTPase 2 domain-containing protein n=1 Tax=Clostridium scatologenes TaxID=1548 RepID=A0A0E3JZJ8_CLOSL|nr:hypothetical protein [Clostridium scatologenes]AKA68370.1 hypothetical protein CSCA_1245 [Clostridium scatologenes]